MGFDLRGLDWPIRAENHGELGRLWGGNGMFTEYRDGSFGEGRVWGFAKPNWKIMLNWLLFQEADRIFRVMFPDFIIRDGSRWRISWSIRCFIRAITRQGISAFVLIEFFNFIVQSCQI